MSMYEKVEQAIITVIVIGVFLGIALGIVQLIAFITGNPIFVE